MTDIKQLPENLKELELTAAFKSVYKKNTVEQLQELLIEAKTDYLSDDNKAALVWRYMDAKGMSFDDVANDKLANADPATATATTEETADHAQTETPVSTNDNSLPTIDSRGEEQPSTSGGHASEAPSNDQGLVAETTTIDAPTPEAEREFVEVTNNGAYNFYETATGTMVTARQATKIYTTATIDKAHILRNINQYNQTRGNLLRITN